MKEYLGKPYYYWIFSSFFSWIIQYGTIFKIYQLLFTSCWYSNTNEILCLNLGPCSLLVLPNFHIFHAVLIYHGAGFHFIKVEPTEASWTASKTLSSMTFQCFIPQTTPHPTSVLSRGLEVRGKSLWKQEWDIIKVWKDEVHTANMPETWEHFLGIDH